MKLSIKPIFTTICISLSLTAGASGARSPYVGELAPYVSPANAPASPEKMTFMADGKHFLALDRQRNAIIRYDIRSGKEIDVFVDLKTTRETVVDGVEGFKLSKNESKVLLWRNSKPIYRRSFSAEYFIYDCHSRAVTPLSKRFTRQQIPAFSPDARMVAFVAENNIYISKLDYKTEVAVTEDGQAGRIINGSSDWTYEEEFSTVSSLAWSPDNSTLCFVKYNEAEVPSYTLPIYEGTCHPNEEYSLYPGVQSYKYPVAGQPNSKVSVHSYDIETRKIKDIELNARSVEYIPRIEYAPTGSLLIVATLNRDQNRLEIYSVNPKSTVIRSIYVEESSAWISPETYEDLRLNEKSMIIRSSRSGFMQVYSYSYAGSLERQITSGDFDVTDYYGADIRGNHYFQAASPSPLDRTIMCLDAKKGTTSVIGAKKGWTSASFTPAMDMAVISYSDAVTPPVYKLCTAEGKEIRILEDNSSYKASLPASLPVKEFFTFDSDGVTLNGYIIRPAAASQSRCPAILVQYSGPESQSVVNRWQLDFEYYYAQKGYVIICVDPRGTGGRGRAFSDIVYKRLGHFETIDQIAAARYAASLPCVDPSRIGIYGWSYGGYEALMCATEPDSPFAATVAIAPVTDWRFYDSVYAERYMLTPQQNFDGYRESAPLMRSSRLRCPLLLMYGTADDNVHPANSLQFVSQLQSQGLLCDMFIFPNMNHSINGCNSRAVVYAKMLDFFDQNLKK